MIATEIDSQWFHNNPDREFRLRRQPPAEFQAWPVPPEPGMVAWCLSRAEQQVVESERHQFRIFLELKEHPDPAAFSRQCKAEAGAATALVVRFVSPADKRRETLQ